MHTQPLFSRIQSSFFLLQLQKVAAWFGGDTTVIIATILFFSTSVLITSNKVFFVLAAMYVLSITAIKRSFSLAILYSWIPLALFGIGQLYVFNAIPAAVLKHPLYPEGRNLYFTFTPHLVLSLSTILFAVLVILKKKVSLFSSIELPIVILIALQLLSAMNTQFFPVLSVFQVMGKLGVLSFMLLFKFVITASNSKLRDKVIVTVIALATLAIIFQSAIAVAQYIKRGPIGLKIEKVTELPYFGAGADEDASQVRPVGLSSHSNILAFDAMNLWIFIFILWLSLPTYFQHKTTKITTISFAITSVLILLTQSRSAYLGWLFITIVILARMHSLRKMLYEYVVLYSKKAKYSILILISLITYTVTNRILYSLNSFNPHGGWGTRELLIEEAYQIIKENPLIGVGQGMFIPSAFHNNSTGVMSYFPEAVHNGFLLMIAEGGIPVLLLMALSTWLLYRTYLMNYNRKLSFFIPIVCIAIAIPMFFQPFSDILPMALVGVYFSVYATQASQKN